MLWAQHLIVWDNFLTLFSLKIYLFIHSFPQQIFIEYQLNGRHIQNAEGIAVKKLKPNQNKTKQKSVSVLKGQVVSEEQIF